MEIGEKIRQRMQSDTYGSLSVGDIFIHNYCIYIKAETQTHIYAVNLKNGFVDDIPDCAYVEKINCIIEEA